MKASAQEGDLKPVGEHLNNVSVDKLRFSSQ